MSSCRPGTMPGPCPGSGIGSTSSSSPTTPTRPGSISGVSGNFLYVEGSEDFEGLYLMTRCRDFVCSMSTFSWWGAWLNEQPDKIVIAPPEGTRPGSVKRCPDFCCPSWIPLDTMRFIVDDYRFFMWQRQWQRRLRRARARDLRGNLRSLAKFVRHALGI